MTAPNRPRPNAGSGFALLGEVLFSGVLMTLLALPVVTLPAALAAGINHLRRFTQHEGSSLSALWRDARDAVVGGLAVAAVALVGIAAALFAIGLAAADRTAVGTVMSLVGWLGLCIIATAVVMAAGAWTPDRGWLRAVRGLRGQLDASPSSAVYVFVAVVLTVVLTWQLRPLLVPSLGVVAFAVVAVGSRGSAERTA